MDIIINELYYGIIRPIEQMGSLTPEEKAILKEKNAFRKAFTLGARLEAEVFTRELSISRE